jgi:lipoprotein-anchoring transpeptidase ErfK/SrfK
MADYFSVIHGAVQNLDPNTVGTRRETYERARKAMLGRLRSVEPVLPIAVIDAELASLNEAIDRVEALFAGATAPVSDGGRSIRRIVAPLLAAVAGLVLAILVVLGTLIWWPKASREARQEPSQTGAAYVYLRQPVFYRTTHPAGSILVDKAQRFLYVVLPNVVALRYGIGVGPECATAAGLYRVTRKEEWPGRAPDSGFGKIRNLFAGNRDDNPLGARALYFNNAYRLHGTNSPASIGGVLPLGCIAVLNDTIVEFYDKAPLETRVVVMD